MPFGPGNPLGGLIKTSTWLLTAAAIVAIAALADITACSRTANGDIVVKRPSAVSVTTTQDTLRMPTIRTHTDTVRAPVAGTQTETLIVKKPVIGTKKTEVKVPSVKQP